MQLWVFYTVAFVFFNSSLIIIIIIIIIIRQIIETLQELKTVTSFEEVHRAAGGSSPSQVTRAQLTTDEQMADLTGEDGERSGKAAETWKVRFARALPGQTWCGLM